jgi:hypothetical protein
MRAALTHARPEELNRSSGGAVKWLKGFTRNGNVLILTYTPEGIPGWGVDRLPGARNGYKYRVTYEGEPFGRAYGTLKEAKEFVEKAPAGEAFPAESSPDVARASFYRSVDQLKAQAAQAVRQGADPVLTYTELTRKITGITKGKK